ncbi:MAG: 4Fe-4S dicluster domain-containing protein [Firmicutes bacterium]|nr:4Fe-4S dicluster domain-containing protein [Bacillota bacterium]
MKISRRSFLKMGGTFALGFTALPGLKAFAASGLLKASPDPKALAGKKWAMAINMKVCREKGPEGCKECVVACHQVHNVPDIGNPKEEVKWIWKEPFANAFPGQEHEYLEETVKGQPFLVLCNHCDNPPCVRVCPTQATFKRKDGIVVMDDHRCIGCRFCMAACPFGARSFNFRDPRPYIPKLNREFPTREKGVVEKCNFCVERLAAGLSPACVEACRHGALVFGDLEDPNAGIRDVLSSRFTIRRKPELGTRPKVYYVV